MTDEKQEKFTGSNTEGGITSSYEMDDGVVLKVPYSFMGSIYDDDERSAALAAMEQDTLTMGPQVAAPPEEPRETPAPPPCERRPQFGSSRRPHSLSAI